MKVAFIGLGRMGTAQAHLARQFGDDILFAVDTNESVRARFEAEFHVIIASSPDDTSILPQYAQVDLLWLTVTDAQIRPVAQQIAPLLAPQTVILHTSGAFSSEMISCVLPGHACGAFHPLLPCPLPGCSDAQCLAHYRHAMHTFDGCDKALLAAQMLARRLDSSLASILPGQKSLYHAAAVFASNYPVTLADIACHAFEKCGFSHEMALSAARRLLLQAAQSVQAAEPVDALTGPVKRGDTQTIERHREALAQTPEWLDLYNILCESTKNMVEGSR